MPIYDDAHAVVLVADYIGVDAAARINALGVGFSITGMGQNGFSAPHHVADLIDIPSQYAGEVFALTLELRDKDANTVVQVPGPAGALEALRIQQATRVERPNLPGYYLPQEMFCRVQAAIAFVNGITLTPGRFYAWSLEIDGHHRPGWEATFYAPGPPPPMVFGGPSGPAAIPNMPPLT